MKNKIIQIGLILGLLIGLTGVTSAQPASQHRVTIPFDFVVGGELLKAGEYSVNYGSLTAGQDVLTIRSRKGKDAVLLSVRQNQKIGKTSKAVIVFTYSGENYALSQIVTRTYGLKFKTPKRKGVLAKNIKRVAIPLSR